MKTKKIFLTIISLVIFAAAGFIYSDQIKIPTANAAGLIPAIEVRPSTTVEVGEEVFFSSVDTTYDVQDLVPVGRHEWDFGDGYSCKHGTGTPGTPYYYIMCSGISQVHYFMTPGDKTVNLNVKIWDAYDNGGYPTSGLQGGTVLGMGSTKTAIANATFTYVINGTKYTLASNAAGTALGNDVVPKDHFGAVGFDIGTDQIIHVVKALDNATGYHSWDEAHAAVPAVAADHVRIGTVAVAANSKAFTFGTTTFDDPGINSNIRPTVQNVLGHHTFIYDIGGTIYHFPKNTLGMSVGTDVIPAGKYGAIAVDVGTDLVAHITSATGNTAGYTTKALALAGIPAVAANHVRMGTVAVIKSDGDFTFGTTAFNAPGVTTAYASVESTPIANKSTTVVIHVTGKEPLTGFEIQRANLNNRTKQYVYVQIPDGYRGNTTQLKLSLLDTTASTSAVLLAKNNLAAEEQYLLDHTGLTVGHNYILQAELLDSGNTRIVDGSKEAIWRDKFTHSVATPTIAINENNSFVVDGQLFFPVGPWMADTGELTKFHNDTSSNSAQMEGYFPTHTPATWGTYLNSCATNSMLCSGPGRGSFMVDYSGYSPAQRWKKNSNTDTMLTYIKAYKNNDAMFAWNWSDEPNLGGYADKTYLSTLAAWEYVAHQEDPNHPATDDYYGYDHSVYYGTKPGIYDYLGSDWFMGGKKWQQDIFGFDIYPIYARLHPALNMASMGPYAAYLDALDRIISYNKNLVPVMPAIQPCWPHSTSTFGVSENQVYFEGWINVIHGVKGVMWFPYFDMARTARWDAMKKFSDQINVLAPVVLGPETTRTIADNSDAALNRVDTMIREKNGSIYVFTARVTEPDPMEGAKYTGVEPTSITTNFTISGLTGNILAEVVDEGRTVSITNGQFTDTFNKDAVHIYRIASDVTADVTSPASPTGLSVQ